MAVVGLVEHAPQAKNVSLAFVSTTDANPIAPVRTAAPMAAAVFVAAVPLVRVAPMRDCAKAAVHPTAVANNAAQMVAVPNVGPVPRGKTAMLQAFV